jgi:hypothetical protein
MSKRGIWVMSGVAAAVLALFVGTSIDFPVGGDKATGTIVPAERWRGTQPTAADVKLNDGTTARQPNVPIAGNAGANAGLSNAGGVNAGGVNAGGVNAGLVNAGAVNAGAVNAGKVNAGKVNEGAVNAGTGQR